MYRSVSRQGGIGRLRTLVLYSTGRSVDLHACRHGCAGRQIHPAPAAVGHLSPSRCGLHARCGVLRLSCCRCCGGQRCRRGLPRRYMACVHPLCAERRILHADYRTVEHGGIYHAVAQRPRLREGVPADPHLRHGGLHRGDVGRQQLLVRTRFGGAGVRPYGQRPVHLHAAGRMRRAGTSARRLLLHAARVSARLLGRQAVEDAGAAPGTGCVRAVQAAQNGDVLHILDAVLPRIRRCWYPFRRYRRRSAFC